MLSEYRECMRTNLLLLPFIVLSGFGSSLAQDLAVGGAKESSAAKKNAPSGKVDLRTIRAAVSSGALTAREGKKALDFSRLKTAVPELDISKKEIDARLKKLEMTWEEGELLLKKVALSANVISNGDFELGKVNVAEKWTASATHPPQRTDQDSQDGLFSVRSLLANDGTTPCEGLLRTVAKVRSGQKYKLEFWIKPMKSGPSYVTQYRLQWNDRNGDSLGGTGFEAFNGKLGKWKKIEVPRLTAPENAATVSLLFRFVTGAVKGGHGEIYLDGVTLSPGESVAKPSER